MDIKLIGASAYHRDVLGDHTVRVPRSNSVHINIGRPGLQRDIMVSRADCKVIGYPAYPRNTLCRVNLRSLPIDSMQVRGRLIAEAAEDPIDATFLAH